MKNLRIWCISDTHTKHSFLDIPQDVDMVIHAGDFSTSRETSQNTTETVEFLHWFKSLKHIKYKILVAGNHDTATERGAVTIRSILGEDGIYLQHESCIIEGLSIFGSPYTPSFGQGWAFNIARQHLDKYWKEIPANTDILVTHGPPKGILDLTDANEASYMEQCGCKALYNRVLGIEPTYHIFGHIHTESAAPNAGMLQIANCKTTFINASCLNLRYEPHHNGFIINICTNSL